MARGQTLTGPALVLDEMISPVVASSLRERGVDCVALQEWDDGRLLRNADDVLLAAALEAERVLVTFDLSTIPALLRRIHEDGKPHAGVVLVSTRTIRTDELGALTNALERFVNDRREENLAGHVLFLARRDL